jgi:hypothetical protein
MQWARHLLNAEDLRKRTEDLQKSRRKTPERQPKNAPPKRPKLPRRNRYSVRTDSGPIALRAFRNMHVEAMNWSGMGHAEYAAALGLSPHALRLWRDRLEESGNEMDWRSLLHPSARAQLSSGANCARRKYRRAGRARTRHIVPSPRPGASPRISALDRHLTTPRDLPLALLCGRIDQRLVLDFLHGELMYTRHDVELLQRRHGGAR